jgi:hypothetical protein
MNTLKNPPQNKVYAAGIVKKDEWLWQGTVVAENIKMASRMLARFKKENKIKGHCEVTEFFGRAYTERPKGVSDSMVLG